ncbi:MAG: hypothetical protein AABX34_05225 [Nanoarchaeota archaeon]
MITKTKKAQTEIMGLAVIFILVISGILFAANFAQGKKEANYKEEFIGVYLAYNTAFVFLGATSRDCGGLSMSELLQDCADNNAGLRITCGALESCAYAEQEAKEIFGKTLGEWNTGYEFTASSGDNKIFSVGRGCSGSKKSKQFPINSGEEVLTVSMDIC